MVLGSVFLFGVAVVGFQVTATTNVNATPREEMLSENENIRRSSSDEHVPLLVGYERFYRDSDDKETKQQAGAFLAQELNCSACHAAGLRKEIATKRAPDLTNLGQRIQLDYLKEYLEDPHVSKPGTTMPDVLESVEPAERQVAIDALVQFLASTGSLPQSAPRRSEIELGETLFHQVGCVACHQSQRAEIELAAHSVPLPELEKKYSLPSLTQFLLDPIHIRPSARMPDLNLNEGEARQIASYLLDGIEVDASMTYRYYEGTWDRLPDFDELEAVETGEASSFDMDSWRRLDQFGVVFEGFFAVQTMGAYQFTIASDDGSRLLVDGRELIRVDGIHPVQTKSERVELNEGVHHIVIEYFERSGGQELYAHVQAPGRERQSLNEVLRSTRKLAEAPAKGFVLDADKIRLGADYFVDLGCSHCHEMRNELNPGPTVIAMPFWDAKLEGGTLAEVREANDSCPDYGLDQTQKEDLRAWIGRLKEHHESKSNTGHDARLANEGLIHDTMLAFNCYACHQRGDLGGVPRDRESWFVGTEPEMGDEGRIPPPLTGVGAKLDPGWLRTVLRDGANDRPYMLTRMPRFGESNVGRLAEAFAADDHTIPPRKIDVEESVRHVKVVGRFLSGRKGLSCIQCHTWGETRSTGVQAMSLTTMTRRLKKDWFQAYMLEPNRFRPGTRMPNSWPRGETYFPEFFAGDVDAQVHAIWVYLDDGLEASPPEGLVSSKRLLLEPKQAPIIYRNFIEGAGTRAIGVGYPEGVNLAFDANERRPALMWQGAFIDASRHWQGRGQGWQPPAGDNVLSLVAGPPFAELDEPDQQWPSFDAVSEHWNFQGYDLDRDRRPSFRFRFRDVQVRDSYFPIADRLYPRFERKLNLVSEHPSEVWMRLAVSDAITAEGDGVYQIGDWWLELPIDSKVRIVKREKGDEELRLFISIDPAGTDVNVLYRW